MDAKAPGYIVHTLLWSGHENKPLNLGESMGRYEYVYVITVVVHINVGSGI